MIKDNIRSEISAKLNRIEREHGVRVLFAIESGSRAWGMPSLDSDYDIRFVYTWPEEHYLRLDLESLSNPLESIFEGELDFSGWDLRKFFLLLKKGNAVPYEWLQPGITYKNHDGSLERLRELTKSFYNDIGSAWHYYNMGKGSLDGMEQSNGVNIKRFFYALRGILASKWSIAGKGPIPMEMMTMAEELVSDDHLLDEIRHLMVLKSTGREKDDIVLPEICRDYLVSAFDDTDPNEAKNHAEKSWDQLNALFYSMIHSAS